uniref:mannan endo-1,4-beta-mannosidase n=1 Tax=Auxenochlorella protothecoides TaxID=3075 RepID=A0A1D1ZTE6_AUXPR
MYTVSQGLALPQRAMVHLCLILAILPYALSTTVSSVSRIAGEVSLDPIVGTERRILNQVEADASSPAFAFVKVAGKQFSVGGKAWYPAGTNAFYAAQTDIMSSADVYLMFKAHAAQGVKVIRVFAHSDGYGFPDNIKTPNPIQPRLGVYNENALMRLDLVIAAAASTGIRLVLVFTNFEPFYGGIQWYVNEAVGQGQSKNLFYTHPNCKLYYKKYVNMLINRRNTVTGVIYRDDPTIFAWNLMNEPHTTDNYEINQGKKPGQIVAAWISEMAAFVKSIDSNHLLTTGEEGYRVRGDTSCCTNNWLNGGVKGVDFDTNVADRNIDFATVHAYPDNWGIAASDYKWYGPNFLADRARIAHAAGKPIVMEEYGSREGYLSSRNELLYYLQDQANALGYAGSMVWSLRHLDSQTGGYVFSYSQDGAAAVKAQLAYAARISGGTAPTPTPTPTPPSGGDCSSCRDNAPDTTYTCAQQASWGKCSESWMSGYCLRSCGKCSCTGGATCSDVAPSAAYSCAQQAAWGKCNESWMAGKCNKSCRRC